MLIVAATWVPCAILLCGLALQLQNLQYFPVLQRGPKTSAQVVACVAIRNGASKVRACIDSLLVQPEVAAVVAVDDGSTDATPAVLAKLASDPRVHIVKSTGYGKAAALAAASEADTAARAKLLYFTDVDVQLLPGALASLIALMEHTRSQGASAWPSVREASSWDTLYFHCVLLFLMQILPMRLAASAKYPGIAAANGQIFLVDRSSYDAAGGHRACRGIVEDVDLAHRLKRRGARIALASASGIAAVDGYGSLWTNVNGYGRSLRHGAGRMGALLFALWQCAAFVLPEVLLPFRPVQCAAAIAIAAVSHAIVSSRTRIWWAVPLCAVFGGVLYAVSAFWIAFDPRPTVWSGRAYK